MAHILHFSLCLSAVRVNLRSIKHDSDADKDSCDTQEVMAIPNDFKEDISISYSYSVTFTVSFWLPMIFVVLVLAFITIDFKLIIL